MQVGLQLTFQNYHGIPDAEMFRTEAKLAVEAEAMGFDFVAPVEHHFTDYAMCPDNAQLLAYVAGKTSKIKLMPGAFILPWNDPLRVVERAIQLDIISEGRVIVGMGRGLARREFNGFRVDMANSREMFDEAAEMIIKGLETGFVEGDGKFFKQPRVEVRPRPEKSFKGRTLMVGMSPSSVETAARLGLATLKFSNAPWIEAVKEVDHYRARYQELHGEKAPSFTISDFLVCFSDRKKIEEYTDKYFRRYYMSVNEHYELSGDHFKDIPSYQNYVEMGKKAAEKGYDKAYKDYVEANLIGTPDEVWEKHLARKEIVGDYDITLNVSYGGMPFEDSWEQIRLFADKVLPRLKG